MIDYVNVKKPANKSSNLPTLKELLVLTSFSFAMFGSFIYLILK